MTELEIEEALREAIRISGSQTNLAHESGISQSTISDYLRKRCGIGNMTLGVFLRLFPKIKMDFQGLGAGDAMKTKIIAMLDNMTEEGKAEALVAIAGMRGKYEKTAENLSVGDFQRVVQRRNREF